MTATGRSPDSQVALGEVVGLEERCELVVTLVPVDA